MNNETGNNYSIDDSFFDDLTSSQVQDYQSHISTTSTENKFNSSQESCLGDLNTDLSSSELSALESDSFDFSNQDSNAVPPNSSDIESSFNIPGLDEMQNSFNDYSLPHNGSLHLHSASTSHNCIYTTINNHGSVSKHTSNNSNDSYIVGRMSGRSVYNTSNCYLGYAGRDGKIYDNHKHCVGWVDGCGYVYNNAGIEVYHTTKGVVGGAAYMLLVYYGGVN